jgi:secondary thiamine-phosphate synthase enzyme
MEIINFSVPSHEGVVEITEQVQAYIEKHRLGNGLVMLQSPEINVGITVIDKDNANMEKDFMSKMNSILPKYDGMQFTGWATAGIKAAFTGQFRQLMVQDGCLILGLHQGIFAVDFDAHDKERTLFIGHLGDALAEGEDACLPEPLTALNARIKAEEDEAKAEEERAIREMREEYARLHAHDNDK